MPGKPGIIRRIEIRGIVEKTDDVEGIVTVSTPHAKELRKGNVILRQIIHTQIRQKK